MQRENDLTAIARQRPRDQSINLEKENQTQTTLEGMDGSKSRQGLQPVPLAAFIATAELAGLRPPVIFALAAEEFDQSAVATAFPTEPPSKDGEAAKGDVALRRQQGSF